MPLVNLVLLGLVLPASVSGVIVAAGLWLGRRSGSGEGSHWIVALALGAGYLAGHLAIALPNWPPGEVTDRIPFLVLAATLLGCLDAARPAPGWARWENRLGLSAVVVLVMLGPTLQENWESRQTILRLTGLGLGLVLSWANLDLLSGRIRGAVLLLPLVAIVAGASAILLASGLMIGARLGGVLAAALGAAWLASCWDARVSLTRGGSTVLTVVLAALILEGHVYSEMPAASAGLLAAAPWAIWVVQLGPIRRLAAWQVAVVATLAVLVPVGLAFGLIPPSEY